MLSIRPIPRALVPVDSNAAHRISDRNYDEFQGDEEVWARLQAAPDSILRVTMAHCATDQVSALLEDGSAEALACSTANMGALAEGSDTREVENALWIYEITSPARPGVRQIGLGCMASTAQIRTAETPDGTIIRNEGIREKKAAGRAKLIKATQSYIGVVNNAFEDEDGAIAAAMEALADARPADFTVVDEKGNTHRSWLETDATIIEDLTTRMAGVRCAYVADGNHRSAAAAHLGRSHFLTVFFPTDRMGLLPYNRLVSTLTVTPQDGTTRTQAFLAALSADFEAETCDGVPHLDHNEIGLYLDGGWTKLSARVHTYDANNAVEVIDADIVQRHIFHKLLDISDARDPRLTFVGGDRPAEYLAGRVDSGEFEFALLMAPVTMQQIVDVCEQDRFMPPKSTWFEPKIRIGLVIALF